MIIYKIPMAHDVKEEYLKIYVTFLVKKSTE